MATPELGPCADWVATANMEQCGCSDLDLEDADWADYTAIASELLYVLSGRRFSGACTATVRPTRRDVVNDRALVSRLPSLDWHSWPTGRLCTGCNHYPNRSGLGCSSTPVVHLGHYPITSITEVLIDGSILAPESYRVDDYQWLVRIDGDGWPCCQDLTAPTTDPDTWSVEFTFGQPPPASGEMAAQRLACELARSCNGRPCQLPKRVQQITRQDLSAVLLDPFEMLAAGRTGVYEVDLFLATFNPEGLREEPVVLSPDMPPPTIQTTWVAGS